MSLLQKFLLAVQFIGFWAVMRTILYALYRDWMNRGIQPVTEPRQSPGSLQGVETTRRGGTFRFENGIALEVVFLAPDIVRTTWTPGKLPAPYALSQEALDENLSPVNPKEYLTTSKQDQTWIFSTPALTLSVHSTGALEYRAPDGELLKCEDAPTRAGEGWTQTFNLQPSEHIYGLGERTAGLNLRGGKYRFWNSDPAGSYGPGTDPVYVSIPVWIGRHLGGSYLTFYENSWEGEVEFRGVPGVPMSSEEGKELGGTVGTVGTEGNSRISFSGGALRAYFIPGGVPHLTRRFSDLTGSASLPPRWTLGFHQSRWGYMNEGDIRRVAEGFRERDLPLAAIHLDIDYMRGFRVFTVDKSRFPDLGKLAGDLDAQGVKVVTIIDPGVKMDGSFDIYREGVEGGMFCSSQEFPKVPMSSEEGGELGGTMGNRRNLKPIRSLVWPGWCAHPDFTSAKVREWWGQYYARLLDQGVAGIWHDMNEPATMAAWGEMTLPRVTGHDLDERGGGHVEAHNLYGMQMNRAGFEGLEKLRAGKRPWIVSRSGWVGNQRYAWNWTGDSESTWAAMRMTIGQVLNMGVSGQPFTGPDIGGFSGEPGAELFVRWFQMAAFMPFFRVHSAKGTSPREPWVYGEEVLGICREYMKLRERLMPYLYTLAWEASQTGAPMCRPLFWLEDTLIPSPSPAGRRASLPLSPRERGLGGEGELWGVDEVFLLGNALLIAPVLEAGAKLKRIPLTSDRWYNFWRDDVLDDSDFVESRVTLDRIPVLVRGGSILPMAEGNGLTLHVYPDREGRASGVVYSDAGEGYGAWRVDRFAWGDGTLRREGEGEFEWLWGEIKTILHG